MATGPGFPSATNVYIPNWDASGRLIIGYSRNPKDFPLMKWAQLVETPSIVGYYKKLSPQEAARVVSVNDYRWARGNPRPMHPEGLEQFNNIEFRTERFDYGFNVDDDMDQLADWDVIETHGQIHAAKAMVCRSIRSITVATTAANWQTSADPDLTVNHTATANAYVGGYLDQGTSTAPYIMQFLNKAAIACNLDTLGMIRTPDLQIAFNPNVAALLAASPEIHEYIKGSPDALEEIRTGLSPNARYSLPSTLYGYPTIVDDTVKITSRKGGALTKVYAFPDQTILMMSRKGGLTAPYGGPNYSTFTIFWHKDEMTLERFPEPKDRLTSCHITEDTAEILTSPLSGFLLTAATSVAS